MVRPDSDELYRRHATELTRYLVRMTGDVDAAQDALHDTFTRLIERPPVTSENVRAWLFTTATNLVRDRIRRTRRHADLRQRAAGLPEPHRQGEDPLAAVERRELRAKLTAALRTLSERERVAVLMREEGFTHREIAKALSSTTGTIGTLLARGFDKLARSLDLDGGAR